MPTTPMYFDFSVLFHQSSKNLRDKGAVHIPEDSSTWPKSWKSVTYKSYPRVPKISLSRKTSKADVFETILSRCSFRNYSTSPAPISKDALSSLLLYSCGLMDPDKRRRAHPSGGGLFPIEIYPIIFAGSQEVPAGLYHYNVKEHALDVLTQQHFTAADIGDLFAYEWIQKSSCALVMTAVFGRNQIKYGERGYRYTLLEAGHIGENIYLVSSALGIKCCGMGGTRDKNIETLIDIDGVTESVVYALILGK